VLFANAGHLRPLLIDDRNEQFLDVERGLPLGLVCGDYSETTVVLSPGTKLIFYSDGITEATNARDEEYGLCRLVEHAIRPEASALSIVDDVQSFSNGSGVRDDATVVFVGVNR
jgi:sigma-B regulation protein RsbU (phosphoserine phosphatase)